MSRYTFDTLQHLDGHKRILAEKQKSKIVTSDLKSSHVTSLYERIRQFKITIPGSVVKEKKKKTSVLTVVSSVILFRTSEYRSRFSTVQSPVELITERQIDPFTETAIKITCAWNAIHVQNETILKYWSNYSSILLSHSSSPPPPPLIPNLYLSVRPSVSACLSLCSFLRPSIRQVHVCMHSLINSPIYHSIINSMLLKCSAVLAWFICFSKRLSPIRACFWRVRMLAAS